METKDKQISVKIPVWLFDRISNDAAEADRSRAWITRDVLCRAYGPVPLLQEPLQLQLESGLPAHR